MELPDDIIDLILSYGDVEVTQRYLGVIRQINYYNTEFIYQQKVNRSSFWYERPAYFKTLFVLMKNKIKIIPNQWIENYKPSTLFLTNLRNNVPMEYLFEFQNHFEYVFEYWVMG